MPSWSDFATAEPEHAATVRERFEAHPYKVLASLRGDGSPRVSGIELEFRDDGELVTGSMPDSAKARDLARDGRFALHNAPEPAAEWEGDATLSGIAHATDGPREGALYFRLELHEATTVGVADGKLHIAVWTPASGLRRWTR